MPLSLPVVNISLTSVSMRVISRTSLSNKQQKPMILSFNLNMFDNTAVGRAVSCVWITPCEMMC